MKIIRKAQLEQLSFDPNDSINKLDTSKHKKNHEKIFLPFINERDNIGRLLGHNLEKTHNKNNLEKSMDNLSTNRKGLLTKIYNDTMVNSSISERQLYDNHNDKSKNFSKFASSIKSIGNRDLQIILVGDNGNSGRSGDGGDGDGIDGDERGIIDRGSPINFEKYNNMQMSTQKEKKKFLNQGSQLKLLSPRSNVNDAPPFGTYDIENSKRFVLKKYPICFISPERETPSATNNKKEKLPDIKSRMPLGRKYKANSYNDYDHSKSGLHSLHHGNHHALPKEALLGKSPFNHLSVEPHDSELMRFNQIMTVKFEDTKTRLYDLKLKIDGFGPVYHKDK